MSNRGRPSVSRTVYGENAKVFEKLWEGQNYRTKRSIADAIYCTAALRIIKEAASDIPGIKAIWNEEKHWYSRSILSQLGRMLLQDGNSEENVLMVTKEVCFLKSKSFSVKRIEQLLRSQRLDE